MEMIPKAETVHWDIVDGQPWRQVMPDGEWEQVAWPDVPEPVVRFMTGQSWN